eukprot:Sspe_Gene.1801::Locus_598_Transcript_1_1_Confidence_1.000_Length_1037::g.1801::m.1801
MMHYQQRDGVLSLSELCLEWSTTAYRVAKQDDSPTGWTFIEEGPTQALVGSLDGTPMVAFRGTDGLADAVRDVQVRLVTNPVGEGYVHRGFSRGYLESVERVDSLVAEARKKCGNTSNIIITGHSLGGGLGTLYALHARKDLGLDVKLVTFGSPRVGNLEFTQQANTLLPNHYRWVHQNDAVTRMPFQGYTRIFPQYEHTGRQCYISEAGGFWIADSPTVFKTFTFRAAELLDGLSTCGVSDMLGDHRIKAYKEAFDFFHAKYLGEGRVPEDVSPSMP